MIFKLLVVLTVATVVEPSSSCESEASSRHHLFQCLAQDSVTSVQHHFYIPNVPVDPSRRSIVNFRATNFRRAIFIPQPQLCNGTITSIEYCYRAPILQSSVSTPQIVFKFFLLIRRDRRNYSVVRDMNVTSIPHRGNGDGTANCTPQLQAQRVFCCDIKNTSFRVSSLHNFAVQTNSGDINLLLFKNSDDRCNVPQFFNATFNRTNGNRGIVVLDDNNRVNDKPLFLLRFLIEPDTFINTPMSPTSLTNISDETVSTNVSATTTNNNDSGSKIAAQVGGVMGVIIIVILLVITVIVVVMLVIEKRKAKRNGGNTNGLTINNAGCTANICYAGTGPQIYATLEPEYSYPQDGLEYYSECGAMSDTLTTLMLSKEEEKAYVLPAKEEEALYAQLQDIRTKKLDRNFIRFDNQLGSGQFGVVYRGILMSSNGEDEEVEVAVKTLKEGSGEEDRVKFLQEAAIMGQFKHHNVVTMYGVVTQGEPVLLVLELLLKGDLSDHLQHMRSGEEGGDVSVDDHTLLSYCRQVASGMAYLSNKAFVHRDLAARNILVSDDDICKIADFGMSRDLADESYYVSRGGRIPVKWTAPEALLYKKYSTASDVWSFGALMYEIWSLGHKPFEDHTNDQVLGVVDSGYRLPPPPGCPRALYNILIACWHSEASQRPSFPEVTRQLSLPDPKLLKWSEEDKCVHPEAAKLGADLNCGQELYKDLQTRYQE